jgi:hypothetical protein
MSSASTTTWILVAVLVVIAIFAVGGWILYARRRTERLRAQFGPEYERELEITRNRRQVEGTLEDRRKRVERFNIQPLVPKDRERFIGSWRIVQAQFVDDPNAAIAEADRLLGDVMSTRGYPVADFDQRAADISVDHPLVVENYRAAHSIAILHSRGKASTEQLRQGMIHYRSLFEELISEPYDVRTRVAS